jgi:hypothetical protein
MKTLTEFSGFVLKDALAKKTALLAEGKTEEEAQGAIHEQLKLDEAKIAFYRNVLDMTSSRIDRVKRVVVALKAAETEKVPENYIEREGHFYLVEYFPGADSGRSHAGRGDDRDDRGGRGRGGRGRNDRGGRGGPGRSEGRGDGRGDGRGPGRGEGRSSDRAPRAEGRFAERKEGAGAESAPRREQRPPRSPRGPMAGADGASRPPRGERKPRPERAPQAERGPRGPRGAGELRLVLKGQSQTTLPGSGVATAGEGQAPVSGEPPQA